MFSFKKYGLNQYIYCIKNIYTLKKKIKSSTFFIFESFDVV